MRLLSPAWLALLLAVPPLLLISLLRARNAPGDLSPLRWRAFLLLRILAVILLSLGLSELVFSRRADRLSVVFLLDESQSVGPEQRSRAIDAIERIRSRMEPGDSAAIVRFGANTEGEELHSGVPVSAEGGGEVDGSATDISSAIQYALAEPAGDGAPRIVLLSDGNENRGRAEEVAPTARALGARVFAVPLPPAPMGSRPGADGEVSIEDIRAPDRVKAGEAHQVTVLLRSRAPARARITLLRDGVPFGFRDGMLDTGENAVAFSGLFLDQGLHVWDALVESARDGAPENNHYRRFVEVEGEPQVLYVAKTGKRSEALLSALKMQGISTAAIEPVGLPGSLAGYLPFDAVILDDVPGFGISFEKMEAMAAFVRDAGGGLLMIGGENSFGAGGYFRTPIERALPVDMDVKSQLQVPSLTLVIVVDKSGSMGGTVETGETKLDIVKSAALSAIELLNPFDKVGLLAFDADYQWTVPIVEAGNREQVSSELASLKPGGGTILLPALEEVRRALSGSPTPLRHVIVLSDGLTNPGDFPALVAKMSAERMTVSTVAVGEDADADVLKKIARDGGGRFYATSDPTDIPRIFVNETMLVSKGMIVEKSFIPRTIAPGEILRGIPTESLPPLDGFTLTYAKPGAETVLTALYDAPLLAAWHYGLGRTAAFTSDFRGRWAREWLRWDRFPQLAAQLVRWIEKPQGAEVLHPRLRLAGGKGSLEVDAYDVSGAFVNGLDVRAVVAGPGGSRVEIRARQTGPGLYSAEFEADRVGDYIVTVSGSPAKPSDLTPAVFPRAIGASIPYSDEYRMLGVDARSLDKISRQGGGAVIDPSRGDFEESGLLKRAVARSSMENIFWRYLLLFALLAFFLDILVRRLDIPPRSARRKAPKSFGQGGPMRPEELEALVARGRDAEKEKLRRRISVTAGEGRIDPELAAYLYIARLKGMKAEKEGKGGQRRDRGTMQRKE